MSISYSCLEGQNSFFLIEPEKAQSIRLDEPRSFGFVFPSGFGGITRALREDDVIVANDFLDETIGIGDGLLVACYGLWRRKRGDDVRGASLEIPEVVQVAVGKDDEAAVL